MKNEYPGCTEIVPGVFLAGSSVYIADDQGEIVTWNTDEITDEADNDENSAFVAIVSAVALAAKHGPESVRANLIDKGLTLQDMVESTARRSG